MLETLLLVGKFVFLLVLYLFIFSVVRSSVKDLRLAAPVAGKKKWRMGDSVEEGSTGEPDARRGERSGVWTLAVRESPCVPEGAAYALPPGTRALAGRSPEMDIYLEDTFVSAKHALFEVKQDGLYVEDLRSTNGTTVGGETIDQPTLLSEGDRVAVGDTVFEVVVR